MGRVSVHLAHEYEQQYPQHTQYTAEKRSAYYVALDIQRQQDVQLESERLRISEEQGEEDILTDQLLLDYAKENKYKEYLVDGAVLRCTKATLDDYQVPDGRKIKLDLDAEEITEDRERTILRVLESPVSVNDLKYATVKHTVMYRDIYPFRCNCKLSTDRGKEVDEIIADKECSSYGVCRHLMDLNEEWDNMSIDGTSYMKKKRALKGGVAAVIPSPTITVEEEGITVTSVLFCKHGGVIYPETSGQQIEIQPTVSALACSTGGAYVDSLSWEQMLDNAKYIFNYFDERDWTTEAICGILGNIYEECKMNPGAWEVYDDEKYGYGIVQWTEAKDFLDKVGLTITEVDNLATADPKKLMDIQLDYLEYTLQPDLEPEERRWLIYSAQAYYKIIPLSSGTPNTMTSEDYCKSTCNPGDLALIFHASYERSGDDKNKLQERIDAANAWFKYFGEGFEITLKDFSS